MPDDTRCLFPECQEDSQHALVNPAGGRVWACAEHLDWVKENIEQMRARDAARARQRRLDRELQVGLFPTEFLDPVEKPESTTTVKKANADAWRPTPAGCTGRRNAKTGYIEHIRECPVHTEGP